LGGYNPPWGGVENSLAVPTVKMASTLKYTLLIAVR